MFINYNGIGTSYREKSGYVVAGGVCFFAIKFTEDKFKLQKKYFLLKELITFKKFLY